MTRTRAKADDLRMRGAAVVKGDLRDTESLEFALRGVNTVISASHSILGKGESASSVVDNDGQRSLIDTAKAAGVANFIYISVFGATLDHPIDFWRTKATIERYLRASGMAYTIIRPTAFMEMHAYELIGKAVMSGRRVPLFGSGKNRRNFVAASDVADLIASAVDNFGFRGDVLEIGGPENLSARQVVATFERVSGRKAKILSVPLTFLRIVAALTKRIHPGVSRIISSGVVSETTDQEYDPGDLLARHPMQLTRLEAFAADRVRATLPLSSADARI